MITLTALQASLLEHLRDGGSQIDWAAKRGAFTGGDMATRLRRYGLIGKAKRCEHNDVDTDLLPVTSRPRYEIPVYARPCDYLVKGERPFADTIILWRDRLIPNMAQGILNEGRWGDGAILADALEEAGYSDCTHPNTTATGCVMVLAILRSPIPDAVPVDTMFPKPSPPTTTAEAETYSERYRQRACYKCPREVWLDAIGRVLMRLASVLERPLLPPATEIVGSSA